MYMILDNCFQNIYLSYASSPDTVYCNLLCGKVEQLWQSLIQRDFFLNKLLHRIILVLECIKQAS